MDNDFGNMDNNLGNMDNYGGNMDNYGGNMDNPGGNMDNHFGNPDVLEKCSVEHHDWLKKTDKYVCSICEYKTIYKTHYERHIVTSKHIKNTKKTSETSLLYECSCGKSYKYCSGLSKHKNKCSLKETSIDPSLKETSIDPSFKETPIDNKLIIELLKQNQDLQTLMIEQNKHMMDLVHKPNTNMNTNMNTTNNSHNNSHNKQFNLNMFLNETCKDAMNITDFVESLKISFADLEKVGEQGFVEGISRIFINGLKELDVNKRPIHCSDVKRDIIHLKNQNEWEKESDEQYPLLSRAIHRISHKNMMTLHSWKDKNPECKNSDSKKSDIYLKWMQQSLGPCDKEKDKQNYGKIIHRVAKETSIQK